MAISSHTNLSLSYGGGGGSSVPGPPGPPGADGVDGANGADGSAGFVEGATFDADGLVVDPATTADWLTGTATDASWVSGFDLVVPPGVTSVRLSGTLAVTLPDDSLGRWQLLKNGSPILNIFADYNNHAAFSKTLIGVVAGDTFRLASINSSPKTLAAGSALSIERIK